jgi:mannose-1-phosphate guanylyltransferase
MKVIILAGGRGTRLAKQSARDIPKVLVKIAGKPILQHQIDHLASHGLSDIRLSLGFRACQIIDYLKGRYEYVIEPEPLGTGGAIKFASADLNEPFMVLNGDIISDVDVAGFAKSHQPKTNVLVVSYHKQNTDFGLLKINDSGKIVKFLEKPSQPTDGYVSVGFYILQPNVFDDINKKTFSIEYDVFPKLADDNKLHSFEHTGFWSDLGTEKRIKLIKKSLALL